MVDIHSCPNGRIVDFDYEVQMALTNRKLAPAVETVFFVPSERYFYLSSSLVRELAAKAGISYDTARAAEAGNLQTGLGAYLAILWAMGLESEIDSFLAPDRDETGKQLEIARQPRRVAHRRTRHDNDF